MALVGTELEKATATTIRVKLLKIGAAVIRNTRRIRILLASYHPLRDVFARAAGAKAIAPSAYLMPSEKTLYVYIIPYYNQIGRYMTWK